MLSAPVGSVVVVLEGRTGRKVGGGRGGLKKSQRIKEAAARDGWTKRSKCT